MQDSMPLILQLELPRDLGVGAALDLRGIAALDLIVEFHVMVLEQILA